jgi:hypothetical protein
MSAKLGIVTPACRGRTACGWVAFGAIVCACRGSDRNARVDEGVGMRSAPIRAGEAAPPPSRVRARYVQGEDGSRFPLGLWDTSLGVACQFSSSRDGKANCFPYLPEQKTQYLYQDSDCQKPMLEVCSWATSEPKIAAWRPPERGFGSPPERPADYAYGLLGRRLEWPSQAYSLGGACVPETMTRHLPECNVYAVEKALTQDDFASGTYVVEDSTR